MLVPLSLVDNAVADMGITCAFLFGLPGGSDDASLKQVLDDLHGATRRVVEKWALLQGKPVWSKEKGIWTIDVPETPLAQERPFLFTSERVHKPYAAAASLSALPQPLDASSSCAFQPAHDLLHFRRPDLPSTFADWAKKGASLLAVHATVFDDALAVGVTTPHGLLDATGTGWAVRALTAELHHQPWDVPPSTWARNALTDKFDEVVARPVSDDPEDVRIAKSALPGWVPAAKVGNIARFLVGYVWEKKWHKDELRHVFLSKKAVEALTKSVKDQVRDETGGKEWVSTGDVLTAWAAKALFGHEPRSGASALLSPVYALREILSLPDYPANSMCPYPFSPSPIPYSTFPTLSLATLALNHRRCLLLARKEPFLQATLKVMLAQAKGNLPLMPFKPWPWEKKGTQVFIVSNQATADVAGLSIPRPSATAATASAADEDEGTLHDVDVSAPPSRKGSAASSTAAAAASDLPLLAYYMRITSPLSDHTSFRFQVNAQGYFFEGAMRRKRWQGVERAVEQLEREFGHGAAAAAAPPVGEKQ
ncbi:hypothetical protein Rhopal_004018-T1 [Rhodotorula paludigena]|uniref:Uncharacterized protein n=1 Tax=Rhodotorula paludigena TaxID=86838 RepID=A0AAV5GM56_9BASI|nr:hypothetical protein Rhopal_004018-T1 [Rhodotorula paludigena]